MYEFASGVINVWEKRVLSQTDQERMLTAPDRASSFMVLFDTDLAEMASGTDDIEQIFEKDLLLLKEKLIKAMEGRNELVDYLFLHFDVLNLKMALKKFFLKGNFLAAEPFSCSLAPYPELEKAIGKLFQGVVSLGAPKEADNIHLPNANLRRIILLVKKNLSHLADIASAKIETAVDRAYFEVKKESAKNISSFLEELVGLQIDVANLKSLVQGGEFIKGGNLNVQDAKELLKGKEEDFGEENLAKFLEILNVSFLIQDFIKNKSNQIVLEQGLQNFLSQRVFEKSRATSSGLEKVLAFFYRKLNSHFNIRLILFAKDNNLSEDEVRNLLLPI